MKAKEIMETNVFTVHKDTTVEDITSILSERNISGVPVVDNDRRVIGIVTQKDLMYKIIEPKLPTYVELLGGLIFLDGAKHYNEELKKLVATKAEDVMTKNVITVDEDDEVEKVARVMVEKDINRIPVVKNGLLKGIISRADIVKYLARVLK